MTSPHSLARNDFQSSCYHFQEHRVGQEGRDRWVHVDGEHVVTDQAQLAAAQLEALQLRDCGSRHADARARLTRRHDAVHTFVWPLAALAAGLAAGLLVATPTPVLDGWRWACAFGKLLWTVGLNQPS